MKLTVNRRELLAAVDNGARAATSLSTLPVVKNLLLDASGERLQVSGTDLKYWVRTSLEAEIATPGRALVSADLFLRIVSGMAEGPVSLELDLDTQALQFRCAGSKYRLPGLDPEDYPLPPPADIRSEVTLPQGPLRRALLAVLPAVNSKQEHEQLRGVHFRIGEGRVEVAATDTHRMHRASMPGPDGDRVSVTVPDRTITEVARLLKETEQPVTLTIGERGFTCSTETWQLTGAIFDKAFPKYEKIDPAAALILHSGQVSTASLQAAARRAKIVAETELIHTNRLVLHWDGPELRVQARGEGSEANEGLSAEFTGEPCMWGVDSDYFLDALKVMGTEQVRCEFSTEEVNMRNGDLDIRHMGVFLPVADPSGVTVRTVLMERSLKDWTPL